MRNLSYRLAVSSLILSAMMLAPMGQAFAAHSCIAPSHNNGSNKYQVDLTVTNTGSTTISGWTVTLGFAQPANVTNSWNLIVSGGNTATVTASNCCSWQALSPGQSTGAGSIG